MLILQVSTQVCSLFSWNHKFKFLILLHVILPYVFLHPSWQDYIASSYYTDSQEEMYGAPKLVKIYHHRNQEICGIEWLNSWSHLCVLHSSQQAIHIGKWPTGLLAFSGRHQQNGRFGGILPAMAMWGLIHNTASYYLNSWEEMHGSPQSIWYRKENRH